MVLTGFYIEKHVKPFCRLSKNKNSYLYVKKIKNRLNREKFMSQKDHEVELLKNDG